MDAAVLTVLSELGGISTLKRSHKMELKAFLSGQQVLTFAPIGHSTKRSAALRLATGVVLCSKKNLISLLQGDTSITCQIFPSGYKAFPRALYQEDTLV